MADLSVGEPRDFTIAVPDEDIANLKQRLALTRWPEPATAEGWTQGVPLDWLQDICDYWADGYDWKSCEAKLNTYPNFLVDVDGLDIHFIHIRSSREDAIPLLLTHGWPGSVLEFMGLIEPLTEPENADDMAFHVVIPALPGYGFSGKPKGTGWGVEKTADGFAALMERLGYSRFVAQGGDWGSIVTTSIAQRHSERCAAIHINMVVALPSAEVMASPTEAEAKGMLALKRHQDQGTGYAKQQMTRPQTLGYGLTDSPVGQAAWVLEKFYEWTDNSGTPDSVVSRDELLDNVSLYWFTASAASSARLYWESYGSGSPDPIESVPVGATIFPREILIPSRRIAEARFKNLIFWNEAEAGGHFAALEQPEQLMADIRATFQAAKESHPERF